MATGVNTTSNVDNVFRPMLAEARRVMEHTPVMTGLVRKEGIPNGQGGVFRLPKWGTFPDAQDLTEGADVTQAQQMSDSLATITPTEVGHMAVFTDRVLETVGSQVLTNAGRLMGDAMARKMDKDGLTMLDGFSLAIGSAGTALTWEHLGAARIAIMGGGGGAAALTEPAPASSPIYGVFHPHQLWPLWKDFAPAGTYPIPGGISEDIQKRGMFPGSIAGLDRIVEAGNLTIDSSDDAKGGVFSKEALILVMDNMPKTRQEESARSRGKLIVQTAWYAYGEYLDSWGREMVFDSVSPTS